MYAKGFQNKMFSNVFKSYPVIYVGILILSRSRSSWRPHRILAIARAHWLVRVRITLTSIAGTTFTALSSNTFSPKFCLFYISENENKAHKKIQISTCGLWSRKCVLFGFSMAGSCRKFKVTLMCMRKTHNSICL